MTARTPTPGDDPPADGRLEDLFARYWDDALTDAEAAEFARLLAANPEAQDRFDLLCTHAVTATERSVVARAVSEGPPRRAGRSVRRPAALVGLVGLAAALAAGVVLLDRGPGPGPVVPVAALQRGAVLARSFGTVRVREAGTEQPARPGDVIDPGDTISTHGVDSGAELTYPDGTAVILAGDTVATLEGDRGNRLVVRAGNVSADVRAGQAVTLATSEAAVAGGRAGARIALGRTPGQTEVGVLEGDVRVTRPEGEPLMDVTGGEIGTVDAGGAARKQALTHPPEVYAWDLTRPLPAGWPAGRLTPAPPQIALRAELWDDPYTNRRTRQVRSDNGWTRGLCALYPDSRIRFRYRVDRPGAGQFLLVVRPDPPSGGHAVVLELPRPFEAAPPGAWQAVDVRGSDLRPEKPFTRPLDFGPPWVVFLVIFNTYETDLGLRVADFRISRPGD